MDIYEPGISIIIPALNEESSIVSSLNQLQNLRSQGVELILVDGASTDATKSLAEPLVDLIISSERGRAIQMNAGASHATKDILLFLHADTSLPDKALQSILAAINKGAIWGRFNIEIIGKPYMLRVISFFINLRSRLSGIATGDQAIFVKKSTFEQIGGFPTIPLMEDLAISDTLKRLAKPACLQDIVKTSGRRWEKHGVWRTIFLMWRLRAAFRLGVAPETLARRYPN